MIANGEKMHGYTFYRHLSSAHNGVRPELPEESSSSDEVAEESEESEEEQILPAPPAPPARRESARRRGRGRVN